MCLFFRVLILLPLYFERSFQAQSDLSVLMFLSTEQCKEGLFVHDFIAFVQKLFHDTATFIVFAQIFQILYVTEIISCNRLSYWLEGFFFNSFETCLVKGPVMQVFDNQHGLMGLCNIMQYFEFIWWILL